MYAGNREWLTHMQIILGESYVDGAILELGSLDINGGARSILVSQRYVGVDLVAGAGVDFVCPASETRFAADDFDLIVCTSMLEHDPNWRISLGHNLPALKTGRLLFLSWGAEGNQHHAPEPWAAVPVGDVIEWASANGLLVMDATWEGSRYAADCRGCYDMVLTKAPWKPILQGLKDAHG